MFNPNERIIGAAYIMQESLLKIVLNEIKLIIPRNDDVTDEEFAASIVHKSDNLSENDIRERIIGAATVMNKNDAYTLWDTILRYIRIPEVTPEEAEKILDKQSGESFLDESEQ